MSEFGERRIVNPAEAESSKENRETNLSDNVKSRLISFAQNLQKVGIIPETPVWVIPEPKINPDINDESAVINSSKQRRLNRIKQIFESKPIEKSAWLISFGQSDYMKTLEEGIAVVYDEASDDFMLGVWQNYVTTVKHHEEDNTADEADIEKIEVLGHGHFSYRQPKVRLSESSTNEYIQTLINNRSMDDERFYGFLDGFLVSVEDSMIDRHASH